MRTGILLNAARRALLSCTAVLAVSACSTYSLEELRHTTPVSDPFQRMLAEMYLAFSESEAQQYDWSDSAYFADKGLLAAYGKPTEPEQPTAWNLPPNTQAEVGKARGELVAMLQSDIRARAPKLAAEAQFYFDCWVEQQEEDWQNEDIDACRTAYYKTMNAIQHPAGELADARTVRGEAGEEENSGAVNTGDASSDPSISTSFIVYFDSGSAKLNAESKRYVRQIVTDILADEEGYEIVLNGHTDTLGPDGFNLRLSESRVEAVRAHMVALGVPPVRISTFAFGKSDPKIPTADGVSEPRNRRVEIFVSP